MIYILFLCLPAAFGGCTLLKNPVQLQKLDELPFLLLFTIMAFSGGCFFLECRRLIEVGNHKLYFSGPAVLGRNPSHTLGPNRLHVFLPDAISYLPMRALI